MDTSIEHLPQTAKVEVSGALLATLIQRGLLHGSDCRCLDHNAKQIVWHSLLSNAVMEQKPICR